MKGVTEHQFEMLQHVAKGGPNGLLDFDQLLDLLSWMPTKAASQFTIRALVKKGLMLKGELELRRGRRRVLYSMTPDGKLALDPRPVPAAEEGESPGPGLAVSEDTSLEDMSEGFGDFEWVE
jgi:hypothetical protein